MMIIRTFGDLKREIATDFAIEVGKPIARFAEKSYWPCEKQNRADGFAAMLPGLRDAYGRIQAAYDHDAIIEALEYAKRIVKTGVEWNMINLLIDTVRKTLHNTGGPSGRASL